MAAASHRVCLTVLALASLASLACFSGSSDESNGDSSAGSEDLPHGIRHVIVITVDTLRADFLACYGHPFVQSPGVDELAQDGVQFMSCSSAAPTTLAAHTSLFTGTYPHTHGVPRNGYEVPEANLMLAEVLQGYGYSTAGFVGAAPLDVDVNFHQGFDVYDAQFTETEGLREGIYQRPAADVTRAALEWLDQRPLEDTDRLFLFLHYFDVHAPYTFPEPYSGMYAARSLQPDGDIDTSMEGLNVVRKALLRRARKRNRRDVPLEEGFTEWMRDEGSEAFARADRMAAEYAAGVTWTDSHLRDLFGALRARGILDETLVVLTSDHGETLLDHTNPFNHGNTTFDSETHVPLILRFPGGQHAGTRVEMPVSSVDVMPTVLSLLEIRIPEDVEGVDLSPLLAGQALERGPVFSEATKPHDKPKFNGDATWQNQGKWQSVRRGKYKFMHRGPDNRSRLCDLDADPNEQHNLLRGRGEAVDALRDELDLVLQQWRSQAAPLDATRSDSQTQRDALEALGYGGSDR